jgi:Uncharacterized conserved protein
VPKVCFTLRVRPDRLDAYRERHAAVWPDMLAALHESGWRNYSLFLDDDGLLIGYLETDDFEAAQAAMAQTEVNTRWQQSMSEFFDGTRADETMHVIPQVFDLDRQLALPETGDEA